MLYNVVEESEEGVCLKEGEARADVLINGERVKLLCEINHDGRVSWKVVLPGNTMSFEEVWKTNQTQDVISSLKKAVEAHLTARSSIMEQSSGGKKHKK